MLLRLFDVFFVLSALYILTLFEVFNYFSLSAVTYYRGVLLAIYINLFGSIFEMYNLQVASSQFQVTKKHPFDSFCDSLVLFANTLFVARVAH